MTSKLTLVLYLIGAIVLVASIMMYYFGIGTLGRDLDKAVFYGGVGLGIMSIGYLFNENKVRIKEVDKLEERIDEIGNMFVDEKYDNQLNKVGGNKNGT